MTRRYGLDACIALAAAAAVVEVIARDEDWAGVLAVALLCGVLLARRRFPFLAPAAVWLIAAATSFADAELIVDTFSASVAGLIAAFLLGSLADQARARLGLGMVLAGSVVLGLNLPGDEAGDLSFTVLFAIAWLAGLALRERAAQAEAAEQRAASAEREREAAARVAVAEERARIARELHDIVAHAVSVMVLQVGAVRHNLPPALEDDKDALTGVERTGRAALKEMRQLLGAMREEGPQFAPQPGLGSLDPLLEELERSGLPVRLHVEGAPFALPEAIDLAAYRIIQEGLTNTLKHARATHADVLVRYDPEELAVEVRDDGMGSGTGDGLGHGLVGVRERVKVHGGEMHAGAANDGGFVLRTRLPLRGYAA